MKFKYWLLGAFVGLINCYAFGDDYVIVGKETKLFDTPDLKGERTKNLSDNEIVLSEGMIFKVSSKTQGWTQAIYTPGVRAYVLDTTLKQSGEISMPEVGNYKVSNNPERVVRLSKEGQTWILSNGNDKLKGLESEKALIFHNHSGDISYSIVKINGQALVYDYDNELTKFF